jgi:hypothetical protein
MAWDQGLADDFGFDEDDLAANRAGRLSAAQEHGYREALRMNLRGSRRSGIMLTVVFGLAGVAAVVMSQATPGGGSTELLVVAGAFAWMGLIIAFFVRRNRRFRRVYAEHRVHAVEGPLELSPTMSDTWWARFGDVRFEVDGTRALALRDGERYRVHYLEAGGVRLPVSLERLAGDTPG